LANKQIFQAKATVESIIEGYEPTDDGILQAAKEKLKQIQTLEAQGSKLEE